MTDAGLNFFASNGAINPITTEGTADETDALTDRGPQRIVFAGAVDNPTDVDMGRFDLAKGTVMVIDVNGETAGVANGTVLRIFDDAGFLDDPELIFVAPNFDDYYIGISGEGNLNDNGFDGTGAVVGTVGDYEVIVHINPTLIGSSGINSLCGTTGADYIVSLGGNDPINGNAGNDALIGGGGVDRLDGGAGDDTLTGNGDDVFVFTSLANVVDTITDFAAASLVEFIDLSAIFAATGSVVNAGNLSQFVQVTPAGIGADSFLGVDANGVTGGISFTIIALVNATTPVQLFDAANFIL